MGLTEMMHEKIIYCYQPTRQGNNCDKLCSSLNKRVQMSLGEPELISTQAIS